MKTPRTVGDDDVQFFRKVFEARFSEYRIKICPYAIQSKESNKLYIEALNRVGVEPPAVETAP